MACSAQMKEDILAKLYDFLEIRWQNYVLLEKPLHKLNHKLRLENQFSKLVYAKLDIRFTNVLSFLHFCMQTISRFCIMIVDVGENVQIFLTLSHQIFLINCCMQIISRSYIMIVDVKPCWGGESVHIFSKLR